MTRLGTLRKVTNIKTIWPNEARDFTPWLSEEDNLALLAEALGFGSEGFEHVRTESRVGSFSTDILCVETGPQGRLVVIENQYGASDHDHLGKLLTYAAGNEAMIAVLIAERIREEHDSAIRFLNKVSDDQFQAFGVELELWQINDGPPAAQFSVVAKPDNWVRHAKEQKRQSSAGKALRPTRQRQQEYWEAFKAALEASKPPFNPVTPQPGSWITHSIGRAGVGLNAAMNTRENWIRAEIYLSGPRSKGYFSLLDQQRDGIEWAFVGRLDWQPLQTGKDARICIVLPDTVPLDEQTWPQQHKWLVETLTKMYHAFHPHVRALDPEMADLLS